MIIIHHGTERSVHFAILRNVYGHLLTACRFTYWTPSGLTRSAIFKILRFIQRGAPL